MESFDQLGPMIRVEPSRALHEIDRVEAERCVDPLPFPGVVSHDELDAERKADRGQRQVATPRQLRLAPMSDAG